MSAKVGIIMGSDSDLAVMSKAAKVLEELKVEYEISIISAHRTPEKLEEYAKTAESRGLEAIICGAGGAAALAGVTAAMTVLPVIGVPMYSKTVGGMDALLSTVQMPSGIPVATVAIDGAKNAGILAAKIAARTDPDLAQRIKDYTADMADGVRKKNEKLGKLGYQGYLDQM